MADLSKNVADFEECDARAEVYESIEDSVVCQNGQPPAAFHRWPTSLVALDWNRISLEPESLSLPEQCPPKVQGYHSLSR